MTSADNSNATAKHPLNDADQELETTAPVSKKWKRGVFPHIASASHAGLPFDISSTAADFPLISPANLVAREKADSDKDSDELQDCIFGDLSGSPGTAAAEDPTDVIKIEDDADSDGGPSSAHPDKSAACRDAKLFKNRGADSFSSDGDDAAVSDTPKFNIAQMIPLRLLGWGIEQEFVTIGGRVAGTLCHSASMRVCLNLCACGSVCLCACVLVCVSVSLEGCVFVFLHIKFSSME